MELCQRVATLCALLRASSSPAVSRVDWVSAALPMVEFGINVCRISTAAMLVIGEMDLEDQARLVIYKRAVVAGYFTDLEAQS